MMVTDLRCWWQNNYVGDFFRYVGDFLNVCNRSPTSQICHQHIWSPTSVTNIDVTIFSATHSKSCTWQMDHAGRVAHASQINFERITFWKLEYFGTVMLNAF